MISKNQEIELKTLINIAINTSIKLEATDITNEKECDICRRAKSIALCDLDNFIFHITNRE